MKGCRGCPGCAAKQRSFRYLSSKPTFTPLDLSTVARKTLLDNSAEFQNQLRLMEVQYTDFSREHVYSLIEFESEFNPRLVDPVTRAVGLFQMSAERVNELGYTTLELQSMTVAEQLKVYHKYLEKWNYQGGSLGILQVSPEFAAKPADTEVYTLRSAKWLKNPHLRGLDGRITVQSINDFYSKQR